MPARRVARVLVDSPLPQLDRLFDYAVPLDLVERARAGVRVKAPLRSAGRTVEGWIVEVIDEEPSDRPLSDLEDVVSPIAVLPPSLYALARKVSDRAAGSVSGILKVAVPRRMVRAEKAHLAADAPPHPAVPAESIAWARTRLAAFPDAAQILHEHGRGALTAPPGVEAVGAVPDDTTGGYVGAWAQLLVAMAVDLLARGRSTVIVVPDHRDQDHVEKVLRARLPEGATVRLDARQSGPARYAAYLRVLAEAPCVVVGNRSAVYAPASDLGAVLVWDDGDPLLAEPLSPGVHARDAALVRQELEGCALVFAGHTRSTDVERLVSVGWIREIAPVRRVIPKTLLSATREGEGRGQRIPSAAFAAAREALEHGPVLVQVARPGYAPVLVCASCRHPARCEHCGGPLHAARHGAVPSCRWCGRSAPAWRCAQCEATSLRMASSGSERTADELGRAFPGVRVIVADGDHPVSEVDARPALVVATRGAEPIAAGGYRAVVLLDAERMLLAEELRIGESCLRWWSNAAALAAPGAPVHLVGVAGPVARAFATWNQPAYARSELAERTPLRMPPVVRVAALEGDRRAVTDALAVLQREVDGLGDGAVLGPVETQDGTVRALVRFDYARGTAVTQNLRSSVIAAALRSRRPAKGRPRSPGNTLRVRVDVPDLDL